MEIVNIVSQDQVFRVSWEFRNGHVWFKDFLTTEARDMFTNSVGLITHPDIDRVTFGIGADSRDLKRVR